MWKRKKIKLLIEAGLSQCRRKFKKFWIGKEIVATIYIIYNIVPGPFYREKDVYDDLHLALLGSRGREPGNFSKSKRLYRGPEPLWGELGFIPSSRAII